MALPLDGLLVGIKKIHALGVLLATAGRDSVLNFGSGITATYDAPSDTTTVSVPDASSSGAGLVPTTAYKSEGMTLHIAGGGGTLWKYHQTYEKLAPRGVVADGWAVDETQDGCYVQTDVSSAKTLYLPIAHGYARITGIYVWMIGASGHVGMPATTPVVVLQARTYDATGFGAWTDVPGSTMVFGGTTSTALYQLPFYGDALPGYETPYQSLLRLKITGETGANALVGLRLIDVNVTGEQL